MSAETRAAVTAALEAHVADECPETPFLVSWVALMETSNLERTGHDDSTMFKDGEGSSYTHKGMMATALYDEGMFDQ